MISTVAYLSTGALCKPINKINPRPGFWGTTERLTNKDDSELLNKPAPEFELVGLDGKIYSLKDFKGKIVVLNFWFIACKPCVNEMPVLNEIKNIYEPKKVIFLALSLDSKEAVNSFLKNHQFYYTLLPGASEEHKKYKLNAYPVSMVIDEKGIISFFQIGGPNIGKNLTIAIEAALKST